MIYLKSPLIILFNISLCFAEAQVMGDRFESSLKSKQAQLTYVYNNATDFAKENDEGEVRGVLVDLMSEFEKFVKEQHGITISVDFVRIEQANFAKFLETVRDGSGGVFGLSNTSISEERKSFLQFSPPFISNITVLVTHNEAPTLNSLDQISVQFAGMKAFSVTSSIYLKRLERIKTQYHPAMEIDFYKSGLEVIEALSKNKEAFAIIDLLYYLSYYKKGYPVKRHSVGDEPGDDFGIIMPLDNDWKPVLDDFFESGFVQSARYREIVSNHLSKSALRLIK